ncbi:hypothetical protein [Natronococcus jeotgali]|uniref:Uncharacterized protein n=1 Tax=Natronococcus jeotgali DSM 18795 TaxID=1227498 RepID=L9XQP0_9EURY|nr:hypothetical protein [Natronococcus jeotgali]ELY64080.1 hypothetical protein C492_06152 [Natronococcus jeotgali DSM 18795]
MHRRTLLAGSAAMATLAGCSDLPSLGDDVAVDETVRDEQTATFAADSGDRLSVSVTVEELAEPDDDAEVSPSAVSFRLDHADEGPLETRSIADAETFDVTVEDDGEHIVIVTNGAASVTIDDA